VGAGSVSSPGEGQIYIFLMQQMPDTKHLANTLPQDFCCVLGTARKEMGLCRASLLTCDIYISGGSATGS
jgi:hypothetical protein